MLGQEEVWVRILQLMAVSLIAATIELYNTDLKPYALKLRPANRTRITMHDPLTEPFVEPKLKPINPRAWRSILKVVKRTKRKDKNLVSSHEHTPSCVESPGEFAKAHGPSTPFNQGFLNTHEKLYRFPFGQAIRDYKQCLLAEDSEPAKKRLKVHSPTSHLFDQCPVIQSRQKNHCFNPNETTYVESFIENCDERTLPTTETVDTKFHNLEELLPQQNLWNQKEFEEDKGTVNKIMITIEAPIEDILDEASSQTSFPNDEDHATSTTIQADETDHDSASVHADAPETSSISPVAKNGKMPRIQLLPIVDDYPDENFDDDSVDLSQPVSLPEDKPLQDPTESEEVEEALLASKGHRTVKQYKLSTTDFKNGHEETREPDSSTQNYIQPTTVRSVPQNGKAGMQRPRTVVELPESELYAYDDIESKPESDVTKARHNAKPTKQHSRTVAKLPKLESQAYDDSESGLENDIVDIDRRTKNTEGLPQEAVELPESELRGPEKMESHLGSKTADVNERDLRKVKQRPRRKVALPKSKVNAYDDLESISETKFTEVGGNPNNLKQPPRTLVKLSESELHAYDQIVIHPESDETEIGADMKTRKQRSQIRVVLPIESHAYDETDSFSESDIAEVSANLKTMTKLPKTVVSSPLSEFHAYDDIESELESDDTDHADTTSDDKRAKNGKHPELELIEQVDSSKPTKKYNFKLSTEQKSSLTEKKSTVGEQLESKAGGIQDVLSQSSRKEVDTLPTTSQRTTEKVPIPSPTAETKSNGSKSAESESDTSTAKLGVTGMRSVPTRRGRDNKLASREAGTDRRRQKPSTHGESLEKKGPKTLSKFKEFAKQRRRQRQQNEINSPKEKMTYTKVRNEIAQCFSGGCSFKLLEQVPWPELDMWGEIGRAFFLYASKLVPMMNFGKDPYDLTMYQKMVLRPHFKTLVDEAKVVYRAELAEVWGIGKWRLRGLRSAQCFCEHIFVSEPESNDETLLMLLARQLTLLKLCKKYKGAPGLGFTYFREWQRTKGVTSQNRLLKEVIGAESIVRDQLNYLKK